MTSNVKHSPKEACMVLRAHSCIYSLAITYETCPPLIVAMSSDSMRRCTSLIEHISRSCAAQYVVIYCRRERRPICSNRPPILFIPPISLLFPSPETRYQKNNNNSALVNSLSDLCHIQEAPHSIYRDHISTGEFNHGNIRAINNIYKELVIYVFMPSSCNYSWNF
jgi:hypothetical protein